MMVVVVGQVWRVMTSAASSQTAQFRVERIEDAVAIGHFAATGREVRCLVSTLVRGLRGARLVREADGATPYRPPTRTRLPEREMTASDSRRTVPPRGMTAGERAAWLRGET
jgi:hypothetical protein